jgi:hypothetical protein
MDNDKKTPAQVRLIIANRLEMQRRRIFQLDFGAPPSHTQCTTDFVNLWFPDAQRQDFWAPLKIKKASAEKPANTAREDLDFQLEEEQFPRFDYGDSESDDGSGQIPLAVLRDHECGDEPLEDKVRAYTIAKAKQQRVDAGLIVTAKEMLELEGESSGEEFEF